MDEAAFREQLSEEVNNITPESHEESNGKSDTEKEWDGLSGGWAKWWPVIERHAHVLSDRMVELAGTAPGHRVLDIASGIGEPALTAARLVGRKGRVFATDISNEMLVLARKRAYDLRLRNVEFLRMGAEEVYRLEGLFNAILCRWGLFFINDLAGALRKIRRRLAPGGSFVAAVWDRPEKVPALSLPVAVAGEILGRKPSSSGVFSLADKTVLERQFKDAGFESIYIEELTIRASFASASEFVLFTRDVSLPLRLLISGQTRERQEEIFASIARAAESFAGPQGRLLMPMSSVIVSAS